MNQDSKKLEMYGGTFGGILPLLVFLVFLIVLSVFERGGTQAFWAGGWIAIVIGLFLAKNKVTYSETIIKGIGDKNGVIIITAWLFAGVFGKLMQAGGLVDGLIWLGLELGAQGAVFTALAFAIAAIFATGVGTSTGTVIALTPVLYPAGIFLGADPAMLAVAILAGGACGDNLSPVSDTTIVSAYTQGATMREVVLTRLPLVVAAGVITIIVLLVAGGGGEVRELADIEQNVSASGLLMLLSLTIVVSAALLNRHIIEALIYGNITAVVIGMIIGNIQLSKLFHIPSERGESTGLIEDGILGVTGAIMFVLLVLAITQVLIESGAMAKLLKSIEKSVAKTVRKAEASIIFITLLVSIPIANNAPALMVIGPSFVKPLGEKFNLAPSRRANLMDCAVNTIFFILPWHVAVIVWHSTLVSTAEAYNIPLPSILVAAFNPYTWGLLLVLIFSVITGWRRTFSAIQKGEKIQEGKNANKAVL
ncbi:Na+/H+ antiporter NhaC family protein [Bacillus sp. RAR_GA_16]|uniref:Na+/H+ antiporter NhaC family protein n=1 Tax=Bacillus sp. RAR_GA_16 TaxID=2876774 RepID=UPI001CC91333|nr:Na+/H+ antiporter NhaC family protein [Bacillus sp. RAR_GA_16]MCA0174561.1 sodium:proton antiporter [Bacillus sp. RAR_GA_16]